jgi:hypothetical protein
MDGMMYDTDSDARQNAKIEAMARVMVLKYLAREMGEHFEFLQNSNRAYARDSQSVRAYDAIAPLVDLGALVGPLFPTVMATHQKLAQVLDDANDEATDADTQAAYKLAVKWGVPKGDPDLFR